MAGEFLGRVAFERGAYPQARQYLSESLAILRQLGDPSMRAHSLSYLGRTSQVLGEFSEAEKLLREGLVLAREINYRVAVGLTLDGLGRVAYSQGRHAEAEAFFSEGADLFREMGDTHRLARTLNHRGLNSLALKHAEDAEKSFQAALKIAYEGGWIPAALYALIGLAALDIHQKNSLETIELASYILQHPASTQETKDLALGLCGELEARLTHEEIEAAQLRAGSKSLDEIVRRFLAGG
jgi:tetratricopeptide (TPR) repeat protein